MQSADAQTMLLDLDGGTYFALNEVGARVWELSDGSRTVAEIAALWAKISPPNSPSRSILRYR